MSELSPLRELMTTASQAPIIVNGTGAQLYELWEERVGLRPPKDFSRNIQVQRGRHDEPFILFWSELINGISISERGTFFKHPSLPSISCTVDGMILDWNAVYEAKCQSEFRNLDDILTWYTPQVLVQMRCTGATRGILGVLQSNLTELEVTVDEAYERQVWEYLAAFQLCVDTMTPPHKRPELIPPELWKTIDLGSVHPLPNWGPDMIEAMRAWSETKDEARRHELSKASAKALLPDDVGTVRYGAMSVKRSKNGAVTMREKDQ
jgi:hypothetical protein